MIKLALVSTKGGVGKTTLAANLGALLADMGLRVLLIDADEKPSLSKYFPLRHPAPHGLTRVITRGLVTREAITPIDLPRLAGCLDIVVSDSPEINLSDWLYSRIDRAVRLNAQASAIGFYARQGFQLDGDLFQEAGIPHQEMRISL